MPPSSELHAQHDPLLVASLAAGDLAGADRDHAAALIDTCVDCAALHTDLVMIARATAALPSAVAPRDFRLTPEQAAALRPRGWRRLIAAIGESRPLMSRQLGIGLATIGLAGLLVSTLPGIQFGSETSTTPLAADSSARQSVTAAAAPSGESDLAGDGSPAAPVAAAASGSPSYLSALPAPTSSGTGGVAIRGVTPGATATPGSAGGGAIYGAGHAVPTATDGLTTDQQTPGTSPEPSSNARVLLVAASLVLLALGIALLAIRRVIGRRSWR